MTSKEDIVLAIEHLQKMRELLKDNPYHIFIESQVNPIYYELRRQVTNIEFVERSGGMK